MIIMYTNKFMLNTLRYDLRDLSLLILVHTYTSVFFSNGSYNNCISLTYSISKIIRYLYRNPNPPPSGAPWATFLRLIDLQLWHCDLLLPMLIVYFYVYFFAYVYVKTHMSHTVSCLIRQYGTS
jgi:hypothetical protein